MPAESGCASFRGPPHTPDHGVSLQAFGTSRQAQLEASGRRTRKLLLFGMPEHSQSAPEAGPPTPSIGTEAATHALPGRLFDIPDVTLAAVEIPGKIKHPSTALRILGGADAASRALVSNGRGGDTLLLRLGSGSSSSSSWGNIAASRQTTAGIVLRRRVRKSGRVELEVLGRVNQKHVFNEEDHQRMALTPDAQALETESTEVRTKAALAPPSSRAGGDPGETTAAKTAARDPSSSHFSAPGKADAADDSPSAMSGEDEVCLSAAAKAAAARAAAAQAQRAPRFIPSLPAAGSAAASTALQKEATVSAEIPTAASGAAAAPGVTGRMESRRNCTEADRTAAAAAGDATQGSSKASATPNPSEGARDEAADAAAALFWPSQTVCATGSNNSSNSKEESAAFNAVGRIGDERLPEAPPPAAAKAFADRELVKSLEELLQKQPVWLRPSLDAQLPPTYTAWRKKPAFAKTCFLFAGNLCPLRVFSMACPVDGPFRGCLCRLGYDPRTDPHSRHYQTIDFRDPYFRTANWKATAAIGGQLPSAGQQQREDAFLAPPSRPSQVYQLCAIQDPEIRQLLHEAPALPVFSNETGWLHKDTLKTLRALMALKSKRMRSGEVDQPLQQQ
ncbi:hypothetical protein cyc_02956 [Cyclospora cayetanensis]|uniref:Transcription factor IIIC subunit 5 HTH domain-containing protein n=1 Tax=Cyclospora cayetanensis TaxID=88456 RepID=A0A1D3D203_9EIME|nr:hypothetical protein cyc_02956 [Cyclospora cayetanensis]